MTNVLSVLPISLPDSLFDRFPAKLRGCVSMLLVRPILVFNLVLQPAFDSLTKHFAFLSPDRLKNIKQVAPTQQKIEKKQ